MLFNNNSSITLFAINFKKYYTLADPLRWYKADIFLSELINKYCCITLNILLITINHIAYVTP